MNSSRDKNSWALLRKNSRDSPLSKLVNRSCHIFQEMLLCTLRRWLREFFYAPLGVDIHYICIHWCVGGFDLGGRQLLEILGIKIYGVDTTGLSLLWCIDCVYSGIWGTRHRQSGIWTIVIYV